MNRFIGVLFSVVLPGSALATEPALTIYNQGFAVVREKVQLKLDKGVNSISYADTTAHVEPDSVIFRDPTGKHEFRILEQNYRSDPVSEGLLLNLYEGKVIEFQVHEKEGVQKIQGKIIRSGYVPHSAGLSTYGPQYYQTQMANVSQSQPIIEMDGKLRFGLPGTPVFPALTDDSILKPTLSWLIETNQAGALVAELAYVTGGMKWEATYNILAPPKGSVLDLIGWVTVDNQSGKRFDEAKVKLIAGDVNKIQRSSPSSGGSGRMDFDSLSRTAPVVTEKTFDEYHMYTLNRSMTLCDRETKQVEFVRAGNIQSKELYVYNGAKIDWNRYGCWDSEAIRQDRNYGTQSNPKIWVMREFMNSSNNGLGIPLPKGRARFYRRDDDGLLEFTGENVIDHTPQDETVRLYTGNAFDLVGERRRTDYQIDTSKRWLDESFEIKLRNHKKNETEVRVVENLYRWINWKIMEKSADFKKTDSQTIEFRVKVPPAGEKVLTYSVHYSW
ncbi:MAG: hypothetical protein V1798_06145 [Pseudomonadota bacterium]